MASARNSAEDTPRPSLLVDDRLWRVLMALAPGAIFLASRVVCLWIVAWLADRHDKLLADMLGSWDGLHYAAIAAQGYDWSGVDPESARSPAFFPGLPWLMSLFSWAFDGNAERSAGIGVSTVAGLVTAYGLVKLAEFVPGLDRAGGLITVAVFGLAPMSIVLTMVYSEALFCALAVWALFFLLKGNWLVAGGLSVLGGLVRPSGLMLAGVVMVAALVAIVRRRATWQTWVGAAIAPLGFLSWIGYVGWRLGDVTAWFTLQREGWHSSFDFGAGTLNFVYRTLKDAPAVLDVVTVSLMIAAVVLLVLSIRQKQPFELILYSAFSLIQVLGSDGVMNSKGRLLIPAFTLLLPIAVFLNRERRSNAVLGIVLVGLMSCWYSAYAVVVYGYAI